jgi:hypothetical protein
MNLMISVELSKKDLMSFTRIEVRNLPGMLFGGTSPLLRPFMKKLECLLPAKKQGGCDSYTLLMLYSYIDSVQADMNLIKVKSGEMTVEITRDELVTMMANKYPASDHSRLNLPGLLFLQSSPGVQAAAVSQIKSKHNLSLPDGRRTLRYIFHTTIITIEADQERMKIGLDLDRLPIKAGNLV